jgi:osmotically-inducible protein OsmY
MKARDGRVILEGSIPESEAHRIAYAVRAVPGMKDVETVNA